MKLFNYGFFFLLIWPSLLLAQTNIGVRAQSFGSAYRAVADSNDTLFFNPAGMLKSRRLSPNFDYMYNADANKHRVGASIVDSKTTSWGLGLGYNGGFTPNSGVVNDHHVVLGLAMPVFTDFFSFGTTFSYINDKPNPADNYEHFFNIDLGLLVNTPVGFSFALVLDHLLKAKGAEKNMGLGFGAAFNLGQLITAAPLTVSLDWLMDNVASTDNLEHVLGVGGEFVALNLIPFRVGFKSSEPSNAKYLSLGTGIKTAGLALDALYQQHLSVGKYRHFGLAFSMNI